MVLNVLVGGGGVFAFFLCGASVVGFVLAFDVGGCILVSLGHAGALDAL